MKMYVLKMGKKKKKKSSSEILLKENCCVTNFQISYFDFTFFESVNTLLLIYFVTADKFNPKWGEEYWIQTVGSSTFS